MARNLVIQCPPTCSLHPDKIGADQAAALLLLRENGAGSQVFPREAAKILGRRLSGGTVSRHLQHYKEAEDPDSGGATPSKVVADLEILNEIIARGFQNSKAWKPTIKDTMEAMKLKMQMTGNSAFDDMLAAMEAGLSLNEGVEDSDEVPEAPEALMDEVERAAEEEIPPEPVY